MEYREIGKTKIKASVLGFGAMRLPMEEKGDKKTVRFEESIKLILKGFENGINIIDTAYPYCYQQSEKIVGKAIKLWNEKNKDSRIYLSTKFPTWKAAKKSDYRRYLEEQLKALDADSVDFYHFHSLNDTYFEEKVLGLDMISEAEKAKSEGLIKHIAFSFHDIPKIMKKIIDTKVFEAVLCQYNILDRANHEAIAYARQKGLGVFIMGPLAGGRILDLNLPDIKKLALKFVLSNPDVSVAFSGMEKIQDVEENISVAKEPFVFSESENELLEKLLKQKEIKDLISCNNCKYCLPCPSNVAIPKILSIHNYYTLTGIKGNCIWQYNNIGLDNDEKKADECTQCGQCEEKCPQNLKIMELIKKSHEIFSNS